MTAPKQRSELHLSEDMAFQRRTWLVERAGWIAFAAILVAALLGLFGGGLLGPTETATEDGSLSMHYERFWRVQSPTQLRVVARPADPRSSALRLWVAREYIEALSISRITPEPERVEAASDRYVFEFRLTEPGETATILFGIEALQAWSLPGRLGIEGGASLSFNQFIYP